LTVDCWLLTVDCWLMTDDCWLLTDDWWLMTHDCWLLTVDCWLLTVEGGVKKMKIARIICWPRDSTLRPTFWARIWYHSGLTAGIDMTDDYHDLEHGPTVAFFFKSGIWSKKLRRRKKEKGITFFLLHHFVCRVWVPWVRSTNLYLKKSIITKLDCRSGIIPAPLATPDRGKTSRAQDQITKISTMLT